jgi:hypothetical protein
MMPSSPYRHQGEDINLRRTLLAFGAAALLFALLACNIGSTATPGLGPVTDTPGLPPPAIAVLRIAYIKGDNVWLWTDGSGSAQLTFSGGASSPSLSADGQVAAFLRSGELWAVNADGTNERQLIGAAYLATLVSAPDTAEVQYVTWRPGTHIIYFTTLTEAGEAGYRIPRFDLNSIDADLGSPSLINLESPGAGGVPYVSPDGSVVALSQPDEVIFMEVTGAFYTVGLTFPMVSTSSEWVYVPELVWLPDSSAVRMVTPAPDPLGDPTQLSTFWNVPVSGTPSALTTFLAVPIFMGFPYVSPDANNVLYLGEVVGGLGIHSITAGGTDTYYTWFATGGVGLIGWNPDSIHITYWQVPTQARILAAGVDNPLGDTPSVTDVSWLSSSQYLYLNGDELRWADLGLPSSLIDSGVSEYDAGTVVY